MAQREGAEDSRCGTASLAMSFITLISDRKATLWLYAACGLIAIPNAELQRWWKSPDTTVESRLLDVFDGAQPMSTPFRPNASQSPDGRLWFANQNVSR